MAGQSPGGLGESFGCDPSPHYHILGEGGDCWGPPDWQGSRRKGGNEAGKQGVKKADRM